MKWFQNCTLLGKFLAAFSAVCALVVALSGFSIVMLASVNNASHEIEVNWLPSIQALSDMRATIDDFRRSELQHILSVDEAAMKNYEGKMAVNIENMQRQRDIYVPLICSAEEQSEYDKFSAALSSYYSVHDRLIEHSRKNENDQARNLSRTESKKLFDEIQAALGKMLEINGKGAVNSSKGAAVLYSRSRIGIIVAMLVTCVLSTGLGLFLSHVVAQPIQETLAVFDALGRNDFTRRHSYVSKDELGTIASKLNLTVESLGLHAEKTAVFIAQIEAINRSQTVLEFTADGTILTANQNFLDTLGYHLDEIKGRQYSSLVDNTERTSLEFQQMWDGLGRGESRTGEYHRIGKDGKVVVIEASYNPIRDISGNLLKIVEYGNDVTEMSRKRAEAVRLSSMIEQSYSNMMYANRDYVIEYMNPASKKKLKTLQGYLPIPVDQIVGQSIDVFHKNPAHQRALLGDPRNLPHKAQIKIGPESIEFVAAPVFDERGKPNGVLVNWEVVTERVNAARQIEENAELEKQRADAMGGILGRINQNAVMLGSSAEELTAISDELLSNAVEASSQAGVVSAAAEQVSKNVQVVATGVEEMNSAIREIARNATDSARVAQKAVADANSANASISKLGDSSVEIGKVIKVITSIAEQTNLLALNATIEAARAGETGKGFAVVANEVKELAKETARATEDISRKIETIQQDTTVAVDSIRQISDVICQINEISSTIASAVEEQTATANEMARNVFEASQGTQEIARNVASVAQAAQCTTQGANNCQQAASELSRMASELQELGRNQDDSGAGARRATDTTAWTSPAGSETKPADKWQDAVLSAVRA